MLKAEKQGSIEIPREREPFHKNWIWAKRKGISLIEETERESRTIAILVEQAEGLLELRDLVVGELLRHSSSSKIRSFFLSKGVVMEERGVRQKGKRLFYF
jgi:hypothetical protein